MGEKLTWKYNTNNTIEVVNFSHTANSHELKHLSNLRPSIPLRALKHIKLDADRDIVPESVSTEMSLSSGGVGATQVIHKYLQHVGFDRAFIQEKILIALNKIFHLTSYSMKSLPAITRPAISGKYF